MAEYYSPRAKKRWCLSLYSNDGQTSSGILPQAAMVCLLLIKTFIGQLHALMCLCMFMFCYYVIIVIIFYFNKLVLFNASDTILPLELFRASCLLILCIYSFFFLKRMPGNVICVVQNQDEDLVSKSMFVFLQFLNLLLFLYNRRVYSVVYIRRRQHTLRKQACSLLILP